MLIYFNGDSNVAGEELDDPKNESMAAVISSELGAEYVTDALSGASNDRIYDTTLKYIENNPAPDLIVIGWSEHGREQWYLNGEFHEVNHMDVGERVPEEYRRRYQFWKSNVKTNSDWHRVMGFYWHNKIYNLHVILKERGIPHYFFNAFFAFHVPENQRLNWNETFYRPYNQNCTYVDWVQERGFKEITPGWLHFSAEAHRAWGEEMVKLMKQDIGI